MLQLNFDVPATLRCFLFCICVNILIYLYILGLIYWLNPSDFSASAHFVMFLFLMCQHKILIHRQILDAFLMRQHTLYQHSFVYR